MGQERVLARNDQPPIRSNRNQANQEGDQPRPGRKNQSTQNDQGQEEKTCVPTYSGVDEPQNPQPIQGHQQDAGPQRYWKTNEGDHQNDGIGGRIEQFVQEINGIE